MLYLMLLLAWLPVAADSPPPAEAKAPAPASWGHPAGKKCLDCHRKETPGLTGQWEDSAHAGAGVNCMDCHQAQKEDPDAFEHKGALIATLVSPPDCGRCHEQQYTQQLGSVHAKAALLIEDKFPALTLHLGGQAVADAGCAQCHGGAVKLKADNTPDPATWPNSGIGRLNPDGSRGSCSACHTRHAFSKAQARQPQACARCHSGSESPDWEVYQASAHGLNFATRHAQLNLAQKSWIAGIDYSDTATCVSCHMGAASGLNPTHDVGMRNTWKLHGPVSEKQVLIVFENGDKINLPVSATLPKKGDEALKADGSTGVVKALAGPERRRQAMLQVCQSCHSAGFSENFMRQFDRVVELYNVKFGQPARALMEDLYKQGRLTPTPFDEALEFIYWRLWHEHGATARHGAAMASPRHVWGEGMFRVAETFYGEFLPEIRRLLGEQDGAALIAAHLGQLEEHRWLADKQFSDPSLGLSPPPANPPAPLPALPKDSAAAQSGD
jgi:hypothetical protein